MSWILQKFWQSWPILASLKVSRNNWYFLSGPPSLGLTLEKNTIWIRWFKCLGAWQKFINLSFCLVLPFSPTCHRFSVRCFSRLLFLCVRYFSRPASLSVRCFLLDRFPLSFRCNRCESGRRGRATSGTGRWGTQCRRGNKQPCFCGKCKKFSFL